MPRSCTLSLVSGVRFAAVGLERVLELLPHTLVQTQLFTSFQL
ncbi:hypothetical protein RchiOBHm_Chr2g0119301 [Rosa chinensis]|uniref:Uncharacterized protein n=1 Tax=Rosa chinensis TaxID=74649 RepID=A0A2P6RRZ5_ROSCH|nr:hypothetical protein RchiOBHm_Chr2g0119301 [Rosa chinensis]